MAGAVDDREPQAGRRGLDPVDDVAKSASLPPGYDAGDRAGELHELAELSVAVVRQRDDRDRADLLQREVEEHELGAVRQLHDHAVERAQAEVEQVEREPVGRASISP